MDNDRIAEYLISILGEDNVRRDEPMNVHTTFRIGGEADFFITPRTEEQILDVVTFLKKTDILYMVVGNGSNLLVNDTGFRGVIVELGDLFSGYEIVNTEGSGAVLVTAKAGMKLTRLGNELASTGIGGFEFATGIPGCIGGAVRMNAGAYGGEFSDIVVSVRVIDNDGLIRELSASELKYAYRTSIVARQDMIVLEARLKLFMGNPEEIRERIKELARKRRQKQPLEYPSAGSTFKRPEGYFAAKLIEDAGLKGYSIGGAQVSDKHAGFVINKGGATAEDVCMLTEHIKKEVKEKYDVELELEIVKVGFQDSLKKEKMLR